MGGVVPAMYFRQSMICASVIPLARSHSASRANSFAVVRPLKIGIKQALRFLCVAKSGGPYFWYSVCSKIRAKIAFFDLVPKGILSVWQTGSYRSAPPNWNKLVQMFVDRINVVCVEAHFWNRGCKQIRSRFMDFTVCELNQLDRRRFNSLGAIQISDPCFAICSAKHFIGFFAFHKNFPLKRKAKDISVESNRTIQIRNCWSYMINSSNHL